MNFKTKSLGFFLFAGWIGCSSITSNNSNNNSNNTPSSSPVIASRPSKIQIGIDFPSFYGSGSALDQDAAKGAQITTNPLTQPSTVLPDLESLGLHYLRQITGAEPLWSNIENNNWNISLADPVIQASNLEPIIIFFAYQYASGTPPGETDPAKFQKTLGDEGKSYLLEVLTRYNSSSTKYIRYAELGNEMDHWQALENGGDADGLPACVPESYSPQEQGIFLKQASDYIKSINPNITILLPGMSAVASYALETWLPGVIQGGGSGFFDIMNYHCYDRWQSCEQNIINLKTKMAELGINKPIWLTETGSTSDPTNNSRTQNNSDVSQASDIFRRALPAYAHGVQAVSFFSYYDNPEDDPNNSTFFGFGIRTITGEAKPSYYSLKLLVSELIPFSTVTDLSTDSSSDTRTYKINTDAGHTKYVMWGSGSTTVPAGMSQMTSVFPNNSGEFTWQNVTPGQTLTLSEVPYLLK